MKPASPAIFPRTSDGVYVVKAESDVVFWISGIVKNSDPVANAAIQSGSRIDTLGEGVCPVRFANGIVRKVIVRK